jgi:hypothetical protein
MHSLSGSLSSTTSTRSAVAVASVLRFVIATSILGTQGGARYDLPRQVQMQLPDAKCRR